MTAKDLKNAILQEAVQGKLVPQIPDKGNAKDLLEEIKKEKAKLIKEGKLKKEKPLSEITDDEIPFDIPENWCWCRLGEVCTIKGGKRLPMGSSFSENVTNHVYIRVSDMKNNTISLNDLHYISDEVYEKIKNYIITTDDIYMTIVGATIGKCGIIPDCLNNMNLTENAARIIPFLVDKHYLLMCLTTDFCQTQFIEKTKQVGVQKMALTRFSNSILPLPPLEEQKLIVAAIEQFLPLIEEYGKKEEELTALNGDIAKTLKNAILQEAVQGKLAPQIASEGNAKDLLEEIKKEKAKLVKEGKLKKEKPLPEIKEDEIPFDIPENWCWCRLGEIISYKMGKTPPRAESEWWEGNGSIPWVSIADMIPDAKISLTKERLSKKAIKEYFGNNLSMKGTLLMSFKLTVGRVSILDIDAVHNEAIISIYPFVNNNDITRDYLFKVLPLLSNYGETKDAIKGKTLNSTSLSNMLIPLPPLAEQKRIVAAIEQLLPLCEKLGQ